MSCKTLAMKRSRPCTLPSIDSMLPMLACWVSINALRSCSLSLNNPATATFNGVGLLGGGAQGDIQLVDNAAEAVRQLVDRSFHLLTGRLK